MPVYHFDDEELLNVAKAVKRFNKYRSDESLSSIIDHMRWTGQTAFTMPNDTYVATGGFCLTRFPKHERPGEYGIKATVSASLFHDLPE